MFRSFDVYIQLRIKVEGWCFDGVWLRCIIPKLCWNLIIKWLDFQTTMLHFPRVSSLLIKIGKNGTFSPHMTVFAPQSGPYLRIFWTYSFSAGRLASALTVAKWKCQKGAMVLGIISWLRTRGKAPRKCRVYTLSFSLKPHKTARIQAWNRVFYANISFHCLLYFISYVRSCKLFWLEFNLNATKKYKNK